MSVPAQAKLLRSYQTSVGEAEKEEEELRKTLDKIYLIRNLRNEMRLAARASGNKENIRRAAHMKMLANSAQVIPDPESYHDPDPDEQSLTITLQTIPLWVGQDGEEAPELCGAVPAEQSYVANVGGELNHSTSSTISTSFTCSTFTPLMKET